MEREDDPDLSPGIGVYAQESERQLLAATQLLDQVAGRAAVLSAWLSTVSLFVLVVLIAAAATAS